MRGEVGREGQWKDASPGPFHISKHSFHTISPLSTMFNVLTQLQITIDGIRPHRKWQNEFGDGKGLAREEGGAKQKQITPSQMLRHEMHAL